MRNKNPDVVMLISRTLASPIKKEETQYMTASGTKTKNLIPAGNHA